MSAKYISMLGGAGTLLVKVLAAAMRFLTVIVMSLGVRMCHGEVLPVQVLDFASRGTTGEGAVLVPGNWVDESFTGQQGSGQANPRITLSPANPSSTNHSATIVAPGRGLHNYNIVKIDTTAFRAGGVLDIDIRISGKSHTDGSFDLFPAGAVLPKAGSTQPSVKGRYDVRRGTSARLEYRFSAGQIFGLGLEGNWFNPNGATGDVQISASVHANAAASGPSAPKPVPASKSALTVLPVVYGPTIQPGGQHLGLCIYLGGRKAAGSEPKADYNWVQKVCASDNGCSNNHGSPFIDNRAPGKNKPAGSYAPNSDFYRNTDAKYYKGDFIDTWINPQDNKPFDYIFFDLPGRKVSEVNERKEITWSAVLNPVRTDVGELSSCPAGQKGPSSGSAANYCKGITITYGYSLHLLDGLKSLVYRYRMDIEPLRIDGVEIKGTAASYGVSVRGPSYAFIHRLDPLTGIPLPGLPMTFSDYFHSENVCQYDSVSKVRAAKDAKNDDSTGPPPPEPAKFRKPFTP